MRIYKSTNIVFPYYIRIDDDLIYTEYTHMDNLKSCVAGWFNDNDIRFFYNYFRMIIEFESKEDAVLFKLRWT